MKTIISIAAVIVCTAVPLAFGQAHSMYDRSYTGPMNVYGQPALTPMSKQQSQALQARQSFPGVFPLMGSAAKGVGHYFWGYLPAPARGAKSPYYVPPGGGQVQTNFVPGAP
jgi:hypothetical protein